MNEPITAPEAAGLDLQQLLALDSLGDLARQAPLLYGGILLVNLIACQAILALAQGRAQTGRPYATVLRLAARLGQAFTLGLALYLAKVRLS